MSSASPILVIVAGAPGAGKTTLGREVSSHLGWPFLSRDELKEALGDELGAPADVAGSQGLGRASYRVLYAVAIRVLEAGVGAVIETNFRRGQAEPDLRPLLELADGRLIHCTAAGPTIANRYAQRYQRGERHPVHLDADRASALTDDLASGRFEPLDLGIPKLVVSTDDGYEPALNEILRFAAAQRGVTAEAALVASR